MSTTSSFSDSDFRPTSTEPETSEIEEKRLFWSGQVFGEPYEKLEVPKFNAVEPGYLADDESETENDEYPRIETRVKKVKTSESHISSSLFHSDSDGFEEKAVL